MLAISSGTEALTNLADTVQSHVESAIILSLAVLGLYLLISLISFLLT